MIAVEVENRSGRAVEDAAAVELARTALAAEGVEEGELGLQFVGAEEMRALKREHLGIDEPTDVLSFPIDGLDPLPEGLAPAARPRPPAPARLRPRAEDGGTRTGAPGVRTRRAPSLIESFNNAFEGIIHTLRTQRNLRIHFAIAFAVLIAALVVNVSKIELIVLLLSITFVLIAEMINSAIEGAIDATTTSFDPNAKLAKDVAAGAVLIASVNAVAVGYLVFSNKVADRSARILDRLRDAPAELTLVALVLTIIVVIATKAWTGRGTPLRGGLPSGHAAIAFAGWMAATYLVGGDRHRFVISSLTFIMAVLVAHTRIESGVHSTLEVLYGGVLGALLTLVLFQVFA
jgi:diacylglycerol kinase (ATP)